MDLDKTQINLNKKHEANLSFLRGQIDQTDDQILELLEIRQKIAAQIGGYKKANSLPILQTNRQEQMFIRLTKKALESNLNTEMILGIWKIILTFSVKSQENMAGGKIA